VFNPSFPFSIFLQYINIGVQFSFIFPLNSFWNRLLPGFTFLHFLVLLTYGRLDPQINQHQWLTTITTFSSLIRPSSTWRTPILSINSSVLDLFLIAKVIAGLASWLTLSLKTSASDTSNGTGSKNFEPGWVGSIFCCSGWSGQVGSAIFGLGLE